MVNMKRNGAVERASLASPLNANDFGTKSNPKSDKSGSTVQMKLPAASSSKAPVKFRMPTSDNLVPIRLDIDTEGQRYKDAFTWNPSGCERTVRDLKLPPQFITQIAQSIQTQLTEFRSYEGQDLYTAEKIVPIKDLNNYESDPEEFARTFCRDMGIEDPEVGPTVAFAIREQLYEIAIQSLASAKEIKISKKGHRAADHALASKAGGNALDLMKLFRYNSSVVGKRKEWDVYEPIVNILSNKEVEALEGREERNIR